MQQVSENVYVEVDYAGCNVGLITTSEGLVLIESPILPSDALKWRETVLSMGKVAYLINTEPHVDHLFGNQFFPEATTVGHEGFRGRLADVRDTVQEAEEWIARDDPSGLELIRGYVPRPPTVTYTGTFDLIVGDRTLHLVNLPGHTPQETAVVVVGEKVVFTGDNVVAHNYPWIQEGDPWDWMDSLGKIAEMDVDTIVPGHGAVCGRNRANQMRGLLRDWVDAVEDAMRRGIDREEAIRTITFLDRYPPPAQDRARRRGVELKNVANIWDLLLARGREQAAP